MSKGKGGGNIIPLIVIGIAVFFSYKANPDFWTQGKLFTDFKTNATKTVETNDIANIPAKEPEAPPPPPQPSVQGAQFIPQDVVSKTIPNDPLYKVFRANHKIIYFAYADCPRGQAMREAIRKGLEQEGLSQDFWFECSLMPQGQTITVEPQNVAQKFLYDNCSNNICILNPPENEIMILPQNSASVIGRAKSLRSW